MAERLDGSAQVQTSTRNFGSWMASEQKRIFLLCRRMLADEGEADSATQDVFLKAWQALDDGVGDLDDPAKWVTRIAVNTCLDRLRSKRWQFWRKRPARDEPLLLASAPDRNPDAAALVFAGEIGGRLTAALGRLTDRQRTIFTLRHYEDLSLSEIASLLNLDVGTVKAHLFRAIEKLRKELQDLYFTSGPEAAGTER